MKQQDTDFVQQKHEYEREIKHLRHLVREKEDAVYSLNGEKK